MADPLVCVSLEGTTVKEMLDEAARAGIAGADMIEVRFDRLYLSRPEPTVTENEEGEITKDHAAGKRVARSGLRRHRRGSLDHRAQRRHCRSQ